ncbi:phosphotransferase [Tumebacillus sp. DT12]|uniref:Phosphotransferase n=1 Tax=Tumebacillus lacus TaxID=2995335 RepID=A0ABT3X5H9_9BACL|nr:phosphotransferase [Tumebacillus lacus]MCX7572161.1 phosphotransferase [Tumebacillus lacus]
MHDVERLIREHWQVEAEQIERVGPVWRVTSTDGEKYCLKAGKHGLPRLLFHHHTIEFLWQNGYTETPRLLLTSQGEPYADTEHSPFVLTRWVGRALDPTSLHEWIGAAESLARFHAASKGMRLPPGIRPHSFKGRWLRRFAVRNERLAALAAGLETADHPFAATARQDAPAVLENARAALQALRLSAYRDLVREVRERPLLTHGNVKAENFTVDRDGSTAIIDFDSFRFDLPVQDLVHLLSGALPALGWSQEHAETLFHAYHRIRPLEPREVPVLLALLRYPYSAAKVLHRYLEPERSPAKSLRKWKKGLEEMYRTDEFLTKWADSLKFRVQ